jgi:hypothetical protein
MARSSPIASSAYESEKHEFDRLCAHLEIKQRLTSPKSPLIDGMVDLLIGRIEDVLQGQHFL